MAAADGFNGFRPRAMEGGPKAGAGGLCTGGSGRVTNPPQVKNLPHNLPLMGKIGGIGHAASGGVRRQFADD